MFTIGNDWDTYLKDAFEKPYFKNLQAFIAEEEKNYTIYPKKEDRFNALKYTPYQAVKVVILGQDPYHGEGQAHGLCFSVPKGVKIPPSLKNIYKEQVSDLGVTMPDHGELVSWAQQGVLLINSVCTVRAKSAGSHAKKGWETFTDEIITLLNQKEQPIVFLLWGNYAQAKQTLITNPKHLILTSVHPSPLSAYQGFFGCHHFSQCNAFLQEHNIAPLEWQL